MLLSRSKTDWSPAQHRNLNSREHQVGWLWTHEGRLPVSSTLTGKSKGGPSLCGVGVLASASLPLACDVLHLEMRKTTPGRPAMEQGCWGTGCSAWPRRRDGTEADPNSFPCHLPLSLCRRWGAGIGKGALSSGELVMLLGL